VLDLLFTIFKCVLVAAAGSIWLSLSGLSRQMDAFGKAVCSLSFGVVFAVLAGFVSFLVGFEHVDLVTVFLTLVLLVLFLVRRRFAGIARPVKMRWLDKKYGLPISLSCVHVIFFAVYWIVFPYFPTTSSLDAWNHLVETTTVMRSVVSGLTETQLTELGAHSLFAFVYSFVGGSLLNSLRVTSAVVDILSILVGYCLFQRVFRERNQRIPEYATIVLSLMLPSDLIYFFYTATYANILGDFFIMLCLLAILISSEQFSVSSVVTLIIVEALALLSHMSVIIFGTVMLACSIVVFKYYPQKIRNYLLTNLGFILLPMIALVMPPHLLYRELDQIITFYKYFAVQSNPANVLHVWIANYVSYAGILAFGVTLVAVAWTVTRARHFESFLLAVWFTFLFLGIFFESVTNNWRFVLFSFVPASALVGRLLAQIHHRLYLLLGKNIRNARMCVACRRIAMIGIIIFLIVSGTFPRMLAATYYAAGGGLQKQIMIHTSMVWLASNATLGGIVVSVDAPEYMYLYGSSKLSYIGDYEFLTVADGYPGNPYEASSLVALQGTLHFSYVVVSAHYVGLQNYRACGALKLIFENSEVAIFRSVGNSCTLNNVYS